MCSSLYTNLHSALPNTAGLSPSDPKDIPQKSFMYLRFGIAFVVTVAVAGFAAWRIWADPFWGQNLRYADSMGPMLTAVDGFFYLSRAQMYALSEAGGSTPLPSLVLAWLHAGTGISLPNLAFWLPLCISPWLFVCYGAWACLLRLSPWATAGLALTASLMPAWVERSRIGWFDTDPGIALLLQACLVTTAFLGLPRRSFNWKGMITLCLCGMLLAWWWQPGAMILPVCLMLWGITFFWAPTRMQANLRLCAALLLVAGALAVLFLPQDFLPPAIAHMRAYGQEHLRLILGLKEEAIFASIAELKVVAFPKFTNAVGGSIAAALLVFLALTVFVVQRYTAALFLLPSIAMLFLGLMGERFLYMAALPLGLALATLPQNFADLVTQYQGPVSTAPPLRKALWAVALGLSTFFCGSALYWQSHWMPDGYFKSSHDEVAVVLRRTSPPQSPVWNWWDDGYFIQARTNLRPFFDGGSQTPHAAWLAARPLLSADPLLARRWIRFFALRGKEALQPFFHIWGEEAAWKNLEAIFSAPDPLAVLAQLPPVPVPVTEPGVQDGSPAQVAAWFFPQGRVFLYLPQRFLQLAQWWIPLGMTRNLKQSSDIQHIESYSRQGFSHTPGTGELTLPPAAVNRGYTAIGAVFDTGIQPLGPPWGDGKPAPYVVVSPLSPWLYIVDNIALQSLAFRLLAPGGAELEGFKLLAVNYATAGAWEVLP